MSETLQVQRFPRLLKGRDAGALVKLLWQKPEFSVQITKDKRYIEFKHCVPVPKRLKSSNRVVWELFFGIGIEHWEKALSMAYWKSKSGQKSAHRYISECLRRIYRDALLVYVEDSPEFLHDEEQKTARRREFWQQAGTKGIKRSQPDPWLALQIFERLETLQPIIKTLRARLRKAKNTGDAFLEQEIKASLPTVPAERALRDITARTGESISKTLFSRISDSSIAEAYIKCELEGLNINFKKNLFKTYVSAGRKTQRVLSKIPT